MCTPGYFPGSCAGSRCPGSRQTLSFPLASSSACSLPASQRGGGGGIHSPVLHQGQGTAWALADCPQSCYLQTALLVPQQRCSSCLHQYVSTAAEGPSSRPRLAAVRDSGTQGYRVRMGSGKPDPQKTLAVRPQPLLTIFQPPPLQVSATALPELTAPAGDAGSKSMRAFSGGWTLLKKHKEEAKSELSLHGHRTCTKNISSALPLSSPEN